MKKFLMVMGAIFCVLLVLFIIGFTTVIIRGTRLDNESRTYADAAIAAIATDWNENAFFERASPELKKAVSPTEGDRLFEAFHKLGHLEHCDPAKGQSYVAAFLGKPRTITGRYE